MGYGLGYIAMIKKKTAKEYLAESAIELLSHGDVESISVSDIANHCGVSTRTFYNHFRDKHDLFLYIYTRELERFFAANQGHVTFRPFVFRSGQILFDYKDFFQNFQKYTGQNNFRDSVYQPLMDSYERIIREEFHDTVTKDLHDALSFWVNGMIGYVSRAYGEPVLEPYEDACEKFVRYMPEILKKYL